MKLDVDRGLMTFESLEHALNIIVDQVDGMPCAVSDIGEPYVEFHARGLARPGDEKIIEHMVISEMCDKLEKYFEDKRGRIYWRHRLSLDVGPHNVVLRLDANGEDVDFITGAKCVMDKNWVKVHCYCRLVKARYMIPLPEELVERKTA